MYLLETRYSANKYLGLFRTPPRIQRLGFIQEFLHRSTNIVLQIDHFELIAFSCDRKQENKVSYYNLILDWEVQRLWALIVEIFPLQVFVEDL